MKILSCEQLRTLDRSTIEQEPIASIDLMERAASTCVQYLLSQTSAETHYLIFCGHGNNGGDGFAIARLLHAQGRLVEVIAVEVGTRSPDNQQNLDRLRALPISVYIVQHERDIPDRRSGVLIDALLGTGVTKPLSGIYLACAQWVNRSDLPVYSIDLPTGLFDRNNTSSNLQTAVRADHTLTFQYPKLAFFLPETGEYFGKWTVLDIGLLNPDDLGMHTTYHCFDSREAHKHYRTRSEFSHKGSFGHALLIGGSEGKYGAILLATEACMRTGAGLTSVLIPERGVDSLLSRLPEAMLAPNTGQGTHLSTIPSLTGFTAIGAGPGLGQEAETAALLKDLVHHAERPLVLDADALNLLAKDPELLDALPEGSILTPHPKEFERLFGTFANSEERIAFMQGIAVDKRLNILLKGHHSVSATQSGKLFFNSTGNSAMAKGGSGDVLTGILTALLAQGYAPEAALPFGVFLHGLSGDLAVAATAPEAVLPSDLIEKIGPAFLQVREFPAQEK